MLKIVTSIDPVEIDGQERKALPVEGDVLQIKAHWCRNDLVVLDWRGHSITVLAQDLERGIRNARNHD